MSGISRREFVIASGALVLPGCELVSAVLPMAPSSPAPSVLSTGPAASAELDFQSGVPLLVAWAARGGSRRLALTETGVTVELPTRSPQTISFEHLRMGVGHDTIKRFFGQPALAALLRAHS